MRKSNNESGSILLSVLFIVMLAVAVVGAAYVATSSQIVLTSRSADVDALQTAGEGVLEYAFGKWKVAMDDNGLMNATATNALVSGTNRPAVPSRMTIESLTIDPVDANGVKVAEAAKTYDYKMSFVYTYVADVKLSSTGVGGKRTVSLRRNLIYTSVPPTRGMFFSEGDFELYKPAKMVIGGDVHTNSNAHVSTGTGSSNLLFLSNSRVTYVGAYDNGIPAGGANWSNSGTNYAPSYETSLASQVKKVPEISGIGLGTASEYNTTDDNPNNDGNRELIEPPVAGKEDPDAIAASRIYNNAGILITVSGPVDPSVTLTAAGTKYTGGNISIEAKNGTSLTNAQATTIRNAVTNRVVTQKQNWVESGYYNNATPKKWIDTSHYETVDVVTQKTFYDKREVQEVPMTNLNVGAITPTLNAATGFNGILYIYDNGTGTKKAIRLTNGGVLPTDGLTIATQDGMYIQGDYNTGTTNNPNSVPANSSPAANASTTVSGYTTKSAAVVADAIMVLSNSWSDDNDSKSVGSRAASNTTLNTALIGGYIASSNSGNNGRSGYSGGMNNFPRFLETWSGDSMTFSGAFVSLYKSKNFTGNWDTGDIYVPPTRYWYFDTLLLSRVLPGIPPNGGFIRGALTRM